MCSNNEKCEIMNGIRNSVWIAPNHIGTIDPYNCEKSATNTIKIDANEAGPINPEKFKNSALKILYLLKEPYISTDSFKKGDRGGHNQSEERNRDPISDGNRTYRRIIDNAAMIATSYDILPEYSSLTEDEKIEFFRTSVCILNVNNFPCICSTQTKDNLIRRWAIENKEHTCWQIQDLKPDVIVCCNTLCHFFENPDYQNPSIIKNWIFEKKPNNDNLFYRRDRLSPILSLLGYEIPLITQSQALVNVCEMQDNYNYCYFNKDVIIIRAYHPVCRKKAWSVKVAEIVNYARKQQQLLS